MPKLLPVRLRLLKTLLLSIPTVRIYRMYWIMLLTAWWLWQVFIMNRFDNRGTYTFKTDTTTGAYAQNSIVMKFGVVYELIRNRVSVFGNYMNGFQTRVASRPAPVNAIPGERHNRPTSWKRSIKTEMLAGRSPVAWGIYYDIWGNQCFTSDPDAVGFNIRIVISNPGFEADIIANPLERIECYCRL